MLISCAERKVPVPLSTHTNIDSRKLHITNVKSWLHDNIKVDFRSIEKSLAVFSALKRWGRVC